MINFKVLLLKKAEHKIKAEFVDIKMKNRV